MEAALESLWLKLKADECDDKHLEEALVTLCALVRLRFRSTDYRNRFFSFRQVVLMTNFNIFDVTVLQSRFYITAFYMQRVVSCASVR